MSIPSRPVVIAVTISTSMTPGDLEQDIEELDNNMPKSNKLVNAELDRE